MELGVLIIRIVDWLQSFKSNYLSVSTQQFLKPFQCQTIYLLFELCQNSFFNSCCEAFLKKNLTLVATALAFGIFAISSFGFFD